MAQYILKLLSPKTIKPKLDAIKKTLNEQGFTIEEFRSLNADFDTHSSSEFSDAYHLSLSTTPSNPHVSKLAKQLSQQQKIDVILQTKAAALQDKKLACFDMDSTLIQHEVMDELAIRYGIGDKISAITASAMRGEINFRQSFEQRIARLKGFDASLIPDIARELKLMPGAITLFKTLKAQRIKTAILSGGFLPFAEHIQKDLGEADYIFANELEISQGKLTGKITNALLVDEHRKYDLIKTLAEKNDWKTTQTIAVGDGANDIPMLQRAGLGIAYHAKPLVQEKAPHCVNHSDLSALLFVLGIERKDFVTS